VLAPDELQVPWEQLEYHALGTSDTLRIDQTGALRLLGASAGAEAGLVGSAAWPALTRAVRDVDGDLIAEAPAQMDPGEGAFFLAAGASRRGFTWTSPAGFSAAQSQLITLLDGLRREALGPDPQARTYPISGARLLHGYTARATEAAEFILRDEDALLRLLSEMLALETIILPEVDFGREMVLAVFLGPRTRRAYDVEIFLEITRTEDGYLQVPVTLYTRAEDCPFSEGAGGAYDLIRLPKTDGEVFFLWDQVDTGCTPP
jgi:hypothetical protein